MRDKIDRHVLDFRSFLSHLERKGQLIRVTKDISSQFELAAVTSKLDGKQAVQFSKVHNSRFSVASNVCGTPERFYLAISAGTDAIDFNKAIHSRITEALGSLAEPKKK
jgi:3-polyprenyl-4-hydroxybenzoate decarboxylase and related decarboxylases